MFTIKVVSKVIGIDNKSQSLPIRAYSCSSYEIHNHQDGWYLIANNSDLEKPLFVSFPKIGELLAAQKHRDTDYEQVITSVYIENQGGKTIDSIGGKSLQIVYNDLQEYLDKCEEC